MARDLHQLATYVSGFRSANVLCLGDVMVDRYVWGTVSRISPEAPIPVMRHEDERVMLGATGNVARNVAALGGRARIVSIVGDDDGGQEVARLVAQQPNLGADLITVPGRWTTIKTRFVARGQQLLRSDRENTRPPDSATEHKLIEAFASALPRADVVLLSDYAKGCAAENVVRAVIAAALRAGKPVMVDPKSADLKRYSGVRLLKPNTRELELATGLPCRDDDSAVTASRRAMELAEVGAVLVTRSEQGMTLVERGGSVHHFKDKAREVFDVSGAGDTALAVLGLAVGAGASLAEAVALANRACTIVVSKVGTAVVYPNELVEALHAAELEPTWAKIHSRTALVDRVESWRARGLTIGLTNGCFDLIHAGHVSLLRQARATCDRLIVALNSDNSVRQLKGEGRPINGETARSIVLASLGDVDAVVVFDENTPLQLMKLIRPDVLIKGADYSESQVVGADLVKSYGGRVMLARLATEFSTTDTVNKIRGANG